MPEWRNWQTHETQNLAPVTRRVGSIPSSGTIVPRPLAIWYSSFMANTSTRVVASPGKRRRTRTVPQRRPEAAVLSEPADVLEIASVAAGRLEERNAQGLEDATVVANLRRTLARNQALTALLARRIKKTTRR